MDYNKKKLFLLLITIVFILFTYQKIKFNEDNTLNEKNFIINNSNSKYLNIIKNLTYEDRIILREFLGNEYSEFKKRKLSNKLFNSFKISFLFTLFYGLMTNNNLGSTLIDSTIIGLLRSSLVSYNLIN